LGQLAERLNDLLMRWRQAMRGHDSRNTRLTLDR